MSPPLVETPIVDAHLHYHPDSPLYHPHVYFQHDVINSAWILSSNELVKGSAA